MGGIPNPANRSAFSKKKALLSGKKMLNLVRLVTWLSTSTCEKSGLIVKSKFKEEFKAILASNPPLPVVSVLLFDLSSLMPPVK